MFHCIFLTHTLQPFIHPLELVQTLSNPGCFPLSQKFKKIWVPGNTNSKHFFDLLHWTIPGKKKTVLLGTTTLFALVLKIGPGKFNTGKWSCIGLASHIHCRRGVKILLHVTGWCYRDRDEPRLYGPLAWCRLYSWCKLTETQEVYTRSPTVLNMGSALLRRSFPLRTDRNCTKKSSSQLKKNKKGKGMNTSKDKKCKYIFECNDQRRQRNVSEINSLKWKTSSQKWPFIWFPTKSERLDYIVKD